MRNFTTQKSVDPKKIKKVDMTYENIRKYKSENINLSRVRTGVDYRGFIYLNESQDIIGFINMRKSDQHIQAIGVNKKYQGQNIEKLLLEELVKIGINKISVNKPNVSLCESCFIMQETINDKCIMTLKPELMKKSQILMEADDDLEATDYGEMEDVDMEEATDEELSAEDYSEGEEETGEETTEEEPVEGEEETGDDMSGEENPEDIGNEDENVEGENINEEQPDNVSDQDSQEDTGKNKFLINDFIELFNRVEEINKKLNGNTKINGTRDPRLVEGRRNMEKIRDVLYDYITTRFEHETYVANLYQFNLIIQAINVNNALIANGYKNDEKDAKKNKKRKK